MNYVSDIKEYLNTVREVLSNFDSNSLSDAMNLIEKTRKDGKCVFLCGNGGSSATASHMCCDFNKGYSGSLEYNANFICLSDNIPTITAIANDISYDEVFSYQLKTRMHNGDLLIVISGSGNSKNIIKAINEAKNKNNKVIAFTGYDGGNAGKLADIVVNSNINDMQISEDLHMIINHCMMSIFCKDLNGK